LGKKTQTPVQAESQLPDEPGAEPSVVASDAEAEAAAAAEAEAAAAAEAAVPAPAKVRIVAVHGDFYHQLTGQKFTQTEETEVDLDSFLQVQIDAGKLRVVNS
jgi:hypothetical protein